MIHLHACVRTLRPDIAVSAQNCWHGPSGAYTGQVSAEMLTDLGVLWVVCGHSERRAHAHESDEYVTGKLHYAQSAGLSVIACVGETLEERQAGRTLEAVCARQLSALAAGVSDWGRVVVAYEPVWAIGTGLVASPEQAQEARPEGGAGGEPGAGSAALGGAARGGRGGG